MSIQNRPIIPTDQEQVILQLLAQDKCLAEIAKELFLSYYTVQFHVKNLKKKYGVKTLHGLIYKSLLP